MYMQETHPILRPQIATGNAQTLGGSLSIVGFLAGAHYADDLLSRTLTTPDSRSKRSTPKEIATGEVRRTVWLDLPDYHIGQLACARAHSRIMNVIAMITLPGFVGGPGGIRRTNTCKSFDHKSCDIEDLTICRSCSTGSKQQWSRARKWSLPITRWA